MAFAECGVQRRATQLILRAEEAAPIQQQASDGQIVVLRSSVEGGRTVLLGLSGDGSMSFQIRHLIRHVYASIGLEKQSSDAGVSVGAGEVERRFLQLRGMRVALRFRRLT